MEEVRFPAAWTAGSTRRLQIDVNAVCLTIIWLAVTALGNKALAGGPDLGQYELAFSDEFNGTQLDAQKWNTGFLWGPYLPINDEEQLYIDTLGMHQGFEHSVFQFTGSSIRIVASPVTDTLQPPERPAQDDPVWSKYAEYRFNGASSAGPGYQPSDVKYLSGLLTSYESYRFTHGYVEARMKLPAGKGLWPAFWTNTSFYVEDVPEIDVMEFIGDQTDRVFHTYHHFETENNWRKVSTPSYTTLGTDFTQDWHTFGMEWGPTEIIWYVDGQETRRIDSTEHDIPNQAMYLLLNLAVGGKWPGSPDAGTAFPAELEIDYVRAYKRKPVTGITPEVLENEFQLMFSDDFNGNSVDTNKWNSSYPWGPYVSINNQQQLYPDVLGEHRNYSKNPITVSNGKLTITATAVIESDLPDAPASDSPQFVRNPDWVFSSRYRNPASRFHRVPDYVSGVLTSYDAFKFVNGYVEMRAKLPRGNGLSPALQLLSGYNVGQRSEIDVMRFRGELVNEIIHSYAFDRAQGMPSETSVTMGADYSADFHTYGIHWQPGRIDWYVDGEIAHTLSSDQISSQLKYLALSMAVGGDDVEAVDQTTLPGAYEIDYIRVWQHSLPAQVETQRQLSNNAPVAADDAGGSLSAGDTITIDVTANDTDTDGRVDPRSVVITSFPKAGYASVDGQGNIVYRNDAAFGATMDRLNYTVRDDRGALSNEATLTIEPITSTRAPGFKLPTITSPVPGSTLQADTVEFSWEDNGTDVWQWYFRAGRSPGAADYDDFRITDGRIRSATISNLPTDGSRVNIEFSYRLADGQWFTRNFDYKASAPAGSPAGEEPGASEPAGTGTPEIISPQPGSTLAGPLVELNWDANGTQVLQWFIRAGPTARSAEYASLRITDRSQTSVVMPGMPTDGSRVFIEFSYRTPAGPWERQVVEYQTPLVAINPNEPVIVSPVPGSRLSGPDVNVRWDAKNTSAQQWYFRAGRSAGSEEYASFRVTDGSLRSAVIKNLPTDGSIVYVEFSHLTADGQWVSKVVQYQAGPSNASLE